MHKFDKIKTAADKRLALDKRGKAAPVDFKVGDSVVLSEKLDGFNTSLDTNGKTYSRSNELGTDMTHHKKLIPFKDMAPILLDEVKKYYGTEDEFQVFGEFMVTDRIIPYDKDVYNKWYIFDVYNMSQGEYLGPLEAKKFTDTVLYKSPEFSELILPLHVIDPDYKFTTYENMEKFVYSESMSSLYGEAGKMEGVVAYTENGLRAKIVNKEFKETQRLVTNGKGHTKAVQWLNQYLTEPRLTKLVKNAVVEGLIDPMSDDYFTKHLSTMKEIVYNDIMEESIDTPEFKGNDEKNVLNKIEAKTRFVMLDEQKYEIASGLDSLSDFPDFKL